MATTNIRWCFPNVRVNIKFASQEPKTLQKSLSKQWNILMTWRGYALSTFANACHEVCSRMSQLSNARSLVSKYVLDRSESKILWLYGFSIFFWCENTKNTKNQICDFWTKFRSVLRFFANSCSFEHEFGLEMQIKHFFINLDASW